MGIREEVPCCQFMISGFLISWNLGIFLTYTHQTNHPNPTFRVPGKNGPGWFDTDYLGIDQGPILIQMENYQTGLIWNIMKKNKYIIHGLKRAGFNGGYLEL